MTLTDFVNLVTETEQTHPVWFDLNADKTASDRAIAASQQSLGLIFPNEYVQFIKKYGGGYFAFSIVYSLDNASDFNIIEINKRKSSVHKNYFLFSENGCGDFYAFEIVNNCCLPEVFFFDHETSAWSKTNYKNLFSFLSEVALAHS